jgi:hypothetical protein
MDNGLTVRRRGAPDLPEENGQNHPKDNAERQEDWQAALRF